MQQLLFTQWQLWRDDSNAQAEAVCSVNLVRVKDNSCSPARINYKECMNFHFALCLCLFAEMGKNINQDLSLRLKRFVEDYHKYAQSLNIPRPKPKTPDHQHEEGQRAKYREGNFYCGSQEAR